MGDVSSKLMAQFADNLNQMIDEQGDEPTPDEAPVVPSDDAAPSDAAATPSDATPAAAPEVAQIRKIEGPATEPIDLMEIGSGSILKRVAPALIAIIVVVLLLRRRRG
jgi:hypothetical protein